MKRILLIGNFEQGTLESFYCKALQMLGIKVYTLDIQMPVRKARNRSRFTKITDHFLPSLFRNPVNDLTLCTMETIRPDVAIVFKGMELFPETIKTMRQGNSLIVNYNPDHPFQFESKGSGNDYVRKSIPYYHIHLSYSERIAADLKNQFNVNTHVLPFGYNNLLKVTQEPYPEFNNRVLFVGAWDRTRAAWLEHFPKGAIDIYGPNTWHTYTSTHTNVHINFQQEGLYGTRYQQSCTQALAHINLLRQQNLKNASHNMRTFEVPGAGGLLIAQRTEEQKAFFEENREAFFFETIEELLDKIQYCQKNPSVVEKMKKNALKRSIDSGYDYISRAKELLKILGNY